MIQIICDACLNRFEVADESAGSTVFCPGCGAKNGVPGGAAAPAPGASAAPAGVAAAGTPAGAIGEQLLLRVRPSMLRARPATCGGLLLLAIGGLVACGYFFMNSQSPWGIVCLVASLLGWIPLGVWKVYTMGTSLEITNKRTVAYRGLLRKASNEVRHNDIKNFQIDQSFLNRILGVGTVGISSSGQDEVEIWVKDLPNPYKIREIIDRHRKL